MESRMDDISRLAKFIPADASKFLAQSRGRNLRRVYLRVLTKTEEEYMFLFFICLNKIVSRGSCLLRHRSACSLMLRAAGGAAAQSPANN